MAVASMELRASAPVAMAAASFNCFIIVEPLLGYDDYIQRSSATLVVLPHLDFVGASPFPIRDVGQKEEGIPAHSQIMPILVYRSLWRRLGREAGSSICETSLIALSHDQRNFALVSNALSRRPLRRRKQGLETFCMRQNSKFHHTGEFPCLVPTNLSLFG